jgi:hypothetical protein
MEMLPDADLMLLYPSSPNTLPSTADTVLTVLSQADLVQALESRENQWRLFPHGWVLVGFEPYRLMSENWQLIYDKCNLIVASNRVSIVHAIQFVSKLINHLINHYCNHGLI